MRAIDDREWAGRQLARLLEPVRPQQPIVFGVARGGVPVARALAAELGAPLDVLVVRKLRKGGRGTSGALAEDGSLVLDSPVADGLHDVALATMVECDRLAALYRHGRAFSPVRGRTAIVVDDAIVAGATMHAAVQLLYRAGAARVVVATPVALAPAADKLRSEVDALFTAREVAPYDRRRGSYWRFGEIDDEHVIECLHGAAVRFRRSVQGRVAA